MVTRRWYIVVCYNSEPMAAGSHPHESTAMPRQVPDFPMAPAAGKGAIWTGSMRRSRR